MCNTRSLIVFYVLQHVLSNIYENHMGPIRRGGSIYFVGQNIRHRTASMHKQTINGSSHACRRRLQASET